MKIAFIADMHGMLDFKVDPCDLLVMAGDICPCRGFPYQACMFQENWLNVELRYWLADQPIKECVAIAGNHDWIWDMADTMVPKMNANFHYLCDESIEYMGLKIYGTPQQKVFNDWAFNREPGVLKRYFDNIPEGLDILITHTPPYKILDKVDFDNFKGHEGCKILKARIMEMKQPPKINVFGHMHGEYGIEEVDYIPGVKFINCSLVNEAYKLVKKPIYVEL